MSTAPIAATAAPQTSQTSQTKASNAAAANASSDSGKDKEAGAITADFETFLKLLTTQLTNQDPLNPLDSTEFVAQIAQFSAVEQQVQTNSALGRIEAALGGGSALTEWLGTEVEAPTALRFTEEPLRMRFDADPEADSALLVVKDAEGKTVDARTLQTGVGEIEWDGRLANGDEAEPGLYSFAVQQNFGDDESTTVTPSGYARVAEARIGVGGGVELVLDSGDTISASEIAAARSAGA